MRVIRVAEAQLPTIWGNFQIVAFKEKNNDKDHVALIYGEISDFKDSEAILTRIHSECLTGDAFYSLRCDCGFQLQAALKAIAEAEKGILLYHRQEGRNIGLLNKIRAYALQDQGSDTVEANHQLGFSADERDFTVCADMLKLLKVQRIRLLTNNPDKVKTLTDFGIHIVERVPLIIGINAENQGYLTTKANKMGHILPKNFT